MSDRQYPSLKSWMIASSIATFLFAVFHVLALKFSDDVLKRKQKSEIAYLLDHTMHQYQRKGKAEQVVVMGSSLVSQGISCVEELNDSNFQNIVLSKIFLNTHRSVLDAFVEAKVFDSLLLHPPAILLIEVDQLVYRIEQDRTLSERLSSGVVFLRSLKTAAAYGIANYRLPDYCGGIIDETMVDSVGETDRHWQPIAFSEQSAMYFYLNKLREAGVHIVMLQVPRFGVAETSIHSGSKEKEFLELVNAYHEKCRMDYWKYPDLLARSYFYDPGHLNKRGRMLYSEWLYTKLKKEIR